ncbi:MAG: GreA/GreB family elongation factor [Planctomycetes bacterium]|nr:GreA/GreB family elongation factor [Planctomycetota bacterium]
MSNGIMESFNRTFETRLAEGDLDGAEAVWLEAIEASPPPLVDLLGAAEILIAMGEEDRVAAMLDLASAVFREAPPALRLRFLRAAIRADRRRDALRQEYVALIRETHPDGPALEMFLRHADIPGAKDPVPAFDLLDRLMAYEVGSYVEHPSGWGVGKVSDVLRDTDQLVVDLERKRSHRISIDAVPNVLRPLPAGHFAAMRFDRVEELRERAKENPIGLVKLVLESAGKPLALKEVKERLVPDIVEAAMWTGFWAKARTAAKHDPYVKITPAHPVRLELLASPISYEEESILRFDEGNVRARAALLRSLQKEGRFTGDLREQILRRLDRPDAPPQAAIEDLFLRREVGEATSEGIGAAIAALPDPLAVIPEMSLPDYRREALSIAMPLVDAEARERAFLSGGHEVREAVLAYERGRSEGPAALTALLEEIAAHPRRHPSAFIWFVRMLEAGTIADIAPPHSRRGLFTKLLDLIAAGSGARSGAEGRETIESIERLISANNCAYFRSLLEGLDEAGARELWHEVTLSRWIDPLIRADLGDIVFTLFPGAARVTHTARTVLEDGRIYTTAKGLTRRREEYREIVEQRLPKVFEEIGRAAQFGDISDNAEFRSALEERDHLSRKAREIKEELDRARIISPDLLEAGVVTVGAIVHARETSSGEEMWFRLLGPWDADPDAGIMSYLAPIGRAFLGARVGDPIEVETPSGRTSYEALEIGDGIPDDSLDSAVRRERAAPGGPSS